MRSLHSLSLLIGLAVFTPACRADPALTPAQTDAVNQLVHDYLMNNPKVLAEAIGHAEDAAKTAESEAATKAITDHQNDLVADPASPVLGDPAGDVTLVEFFDYRCPYCKATAPIVDQLLESDKHVRLVLKEYPILGDDSVFASRVALVAAKHGKYASVHAALLSFKGKVTPAEALDLAKSPDLSVKAIKDEMQSAEISDDIKRNTALADTLKIDGPADLYRGRRLDSRRRHPGRSARRHRHGAPAQG